MPRAVAGGSPASVSAVCLGSARRSSTAPVSASTVEASAGTTTRTSVARGTRPARRPFLAARRRAPDAFPTGVADASRARVGCAGTGSCISHLTIPADREDRRCDADPRVDVGGDDDHERAADHDDEETERLGFAAKRILRVTQRM